MNEYNCKKCKWYVPNRVFPFFMSAECQGEEEHQKEHGCDGYEPKWYWRLLGE